MVVRPLLCLEWTSPQQFPMRCGHWWWYHQFCPVPEKIDDLLEGLEIRYLANRDTHLHFGLLTDLVDAKQEIMPEDEHLLQRARQGIEALNERYHESIFFLFPRLRRWDSEEEIWRGYERKRGILEELNFLLRGDPKTAFL